MRSIILFIFCSCLSVTSHATQIKNDTVFTENSLKEQATALNISFEDVKKYHNLMNSPAGVFYKRGEANIFYVLTAEAETEAERKKFAQLWVEAEAAYYEKLGKAMNAYSLAAINKFGTNPNIWNLKAYDDLIESNQASYSSANKRVKLYVNTQNCAACLAKFNDLNQRLSRNEIAGIDIYFSDVGRSKDAIARWAMAMKIAQKTVQQKTITLNFDDGKGKGEKPYVEDYYILD